MATLIHQLRRHAAASAPLVTPREEQRLDAERSVRFVELLAREAHDGAAIILDPAHAPEDLYGARLYQRLVMRNGCCVRLIVNRKRQAELIADLELHTRGQSFRIDTPEGPPCLEFAGGEGESSDGRPAWPSDLQAMAGEARGGRCIVRAARPIRRASAAVARGTASAALVADTKRRRLKASAWRKCRRGNGDATGRRVGGSGRSWRRRIGPTSACDASGLHDAWRSKRPGARVCGSRAGCGCEPVRARGQFGPSASRRGVVKLLTGMVPAGGLEPPTS
jgi:hypothetical protein